MNKFLTFVWPRFARIILTYVRSSYGRKILSYTWPYLATLLLHSLAILACLVISSHYKPPESNVYQGVVLGIDYAYAIPLFLFILWRDAAHNVLRSIVELLREQGKE